MLADRDSTAKGGGWKLKERKRGMVKERNAFFPL
jgi:hypothetical protein